MKRLNLLLVGLLTASLATPAVAIDFNPEEVINSALQAVLSEETKKVVDTFAQEQIYKFVNLMYRNQKTSCAIMALGALATTVVACKMVASMFSSKAKPAQEVDPRNNCL